MVVVGGVAVSYERGTPVTRADRRLQVLLGLSSAYTLYAW
jgi:hypothetical protein